MTLSANKVHDIKCCYPACVSVCMHIACVYFLPLPDGAVCNIGVFDVLFGVVDAICVRIDLLVSEVFAAEDIIL